LRGGNSGRRFLRGDNRLKVGGKGFLNKRKLKLNIGEKKTISKQR